MTTEDIIKWTDDSQRAFTWLKVLHDELPEAVDPLGIADFIFEEMPDVHRKALEMLINLELEPGVYGEVVLEEKALLDGMRPMGMCHADGSKLSYQGVVVYYRPESVPREKSPVPLPPKRPGEKINGFTYKIDPYDDQRWFVPLLPDKIPSFEHVHTKLLSLEMWRFPFSDGISGGSYICHPKAAMLLMTGGFEFEWTCEWIEEYSAYTFYFEQMYNLSQGAIYLSLKRDVLSFMSYYSRYSDDNQLDKKNMSSPIYRFPGYLVAAPGEKALGFADSYFDVEEFCGEHIEAPKEPTPQIATFDYIVHDDHLGINTRTDYQFGRSTSNSKTTCVNQGGVGIFKYVSQPGLSGNPSSWAVNVDMCALKIPDGPDDAPWYFPPVEEPRPPGDGGIPALTAISLLTNFGLRITHRKKEV